SGPAQAVRGHGAGALPLPVAAAFLRAIGGVAAREIAAHPPSRLLLGRRARQVARQGAGDWRVLLDDGSTLHTRRVLFAMGGRQELAEALGRELLPGLRLVDGFAARCMLTGELFAEGGVLRLRRRLAGIAAPRAVIVGGSHSAVTAAQVLLASAGLPWGPGAITLLHRRAPRLFYPDRDAARADGYLQFGRDDVCPRTGRVFRLAGLRMAARELLRQAWGLGGAAPEPRLCLAELPAMAPAALRALLAGADVIVPAFGYRPNTVQVVDEQGRRIALRAEAGPREPLVDAQCRVLAADGSALPDLFGIGLASGFVPRDAQLGGEASFDGQTNGLWLYQNGVGRRVLDQLRGG
ncbi:MAG TPA: hypothetical protein VLA16_18005, partial [Ideonella sp.]|nr:hypothetical protein [Ideonella sp.]